MSQLRRWLAEPGLPGEVIITEPAGYRFQVDQQQVDAYQFRTRVAKARAAVASGRDRDARESYRAAVCLWRGPALAGVDSDLGIP